MLQQGLDTAKLKKKNCCYNLPFNPYTTCALPSNKVQTLAFPHSRKAFLASTPLHMLFSYQHEPPLSVFPAGYSYPSRSNSKNDFPKENFRNHNPQLHCHPVDIFSFTLDASGSVVKNLQETRTRFLGQEDPLEEGMVIHSSILAWRIFWRQEPGRLQSIGSQRVTHD